MAENIVVKIEVDDSQLKALKPELDKLGVKIKDTGKRFEETGKQANESLSTLKTGLKDVAVAFGIAFSIEKIVEFGKKSVEEFQKAEKAAKQLEFAVKNIGKEGDAAVEKLKRLADRLSSKNNFSIFDNDDIVKAEAMLSTLGLTSRQIEKLIPSIIEAASVTGDLQGTSELYANAINGRLSPELKRLGVNFDVTGDRQENFNKLIEKSKVLAGAAGAALNTAGGQAQKFQNDIGDLEEELGSKLAPIINQIRFGFLNLINDILGGNNSGSKLLDEQIENYQNANEAVKKAARELAELELKNAKERLRVSNYVNESIRDNEKKLANEQINKAQKLLTAFAEIDKKQVEIDLGKTDEEIARRKAASDQAIKAAQELADKTREINERNVAALKKQYDDEQALTDENETKRVHAEIDADNEINKGRDRMLKENADLEEKARKDKEQADRDALEAKKKLIEEEKAATLSSVQSISDAVFAITSANRNAELDLALHNLEKEHNATVGNKRLTDKQKAKLDEEYQKKVFALKLDAAKKDKEAAEIQAAINGAVAFVAALPNYILAASVAGATATQIAIIAAEPLPKYAKGVKSVPGRGNSDNVHALLTPGERVITQSTNKDYRPVLDAIHDGIIPSGVLNSFALNFKYRGLGDQKFNKNGGIDFSKIAKGVGREISGSNEAVIKELRRGNPNGGLSEIVKAINNSPNFRRQ